MSLVEMQSALARIYTDGPFLEWFDRDSSAALRGYDLTSAEQEALIGIDRPALRSFARSLRFKNWGRFRRTYRLVHTLGEATVQRYFMRFYELRPIRPNEGFYRPNIEFGEFLEDSFRGNPELPPYASDLARYEKLFHYARFEPRPEGIASGEPTESEIELSPSSRLTLRPGVQLARFSYAMGKLEKELKSGTVPSDAEKSACHVVFQSFKRVGRAKKFHVTESTANLLALSNGKRDVAAVAQALDADCEPVLAATRKMQTLDLLSLSSLGSQRIEHEGEPS